MKKLLVTIIAALALTACAKRPTGSVAYVGEFKISKLFTYDGCTVYRFSDGGNLRYFAKCSDASSSEASGSYSCGKSCSRDESLPTSYANDQ